MEAAAGVLLCATALGAAAARVLPELAILSGKIAEPAINVSRFVPENSLLSTERFAGIGASYKTDLGRLAKLEPTFVAHVGFNLDRAVTDAFASRAIITSEPFNDASIAAEIRRVRWSNSDPLGNVYGRKRNVCWFYPGNSLREIAGDALIRKHTSLELSGDADAITATRAGLSSYLHRILEDADFDSTFHRWGER